MTAYGPSGTGLANGMAVGGFRRALEDELPAGEFL